MNRIKTYILILLAAFAFNSCDDDSPFGGGDNSIISFQLKLGEETYQAAISDNKVVITVPNNISLSGATATLVLSENATISPSPASITDWNKDYTFTVKSHNGTEKTYNYTIDRNAAAKEGDVVLRTQADVEALAALGIDQINGTLTVGATSGKDSIYSLAPLSGLKTIANGLVINSTYAAKNLNGLTDLEKVGYLQITGVKGLDEINLPKLKTVVSNLAITSTEVKAITFPELVSIEKGLQIQSISSVSKIEFPKLETIVENFSFQNSYTQSEIKDLAFPVLKKVGGIVKVYDWAGLENIKLPELKNTLSLNILSLGDLQSFVAPKVESTFGDVIVSYCLKLKQMNLESLQSTAGKLDLENLAIEDFSGLKSLKTISGELFISNLAKLKKTQGLNSLTSVGTRIYFSYCPALEDNLDGLANLNSVGGSISLTSLGFKKFTGFALKSVSEISISGNNVTIEEVDVTNIDITGTLTISNIKNAFKLKGKKIFSGKLSFSNSYINIEGFEEVGTLSYYTSEKIQNTQTLPVKKISGSVSLQMYNFDTFSMPNLTEVGGEFSLTCSSSMNLNFPVLKKTGKMGIDATNNETISFPALEQVSGNCTIVSGNYQGSNMSSISMLALKTVDGVLDISGYSDYYTNKKLTNLNGFANLTSVKGIKVNYNESLSDYSGLKKAISSITSAGWSVAGNAYNPTYQDVVNGKWVKP